MRRRPVVFDASVLIPVLLPTADDDDEACAEAALGDPNSDIIAPTLIDLEVLNAAARRRNVDADALVRIAGYLEDPHMERIDPSLADVARWCAAGLSAYAPSTPPSQRNSTRCFSPPIKPFSMRSPSARARRTRRSDGSAGVEPRQATSVGARSRGRPPTRDVATP
jgi:hypothetical protein